MAFNLGAFAGGLVSGGLKTYTTLKEQERLEGIEARDKTRFEEEQRQIELRRQAEDIARKAVIPEGGGEKIGTIAEAIPRSALYAGNEKGLTGRSEEEVAANEQAFVSALKGLTPEQQALVLRGYGDTSNAGGREFEAKRRADTEGKYGIPTGLNTAVVREDPSGERFVVSASTDEKAIVARHKQLAMASGNPVAIKAAHEAEATMLNREVAQQTLKLGEQNIAMNVFKLSEAKSAQEFTERFNKSLVDAKTENVKLLKQVDEAANDPKATVDSLLKQFGTQIKDVTGQSYYAKDGKIYTKDAGGNETVVADSLDQAKILLKQGAGAHFAKDLSDRIVKEGLFKTPEAFNAFYEAERKWVTDAAGVANARVMAAAAATNAATSAAELEAKKNAGTFQAAADASRNASAASLKQIGYYERMAKIAGDKLNLETEARTALAAELKKFGELTVEQQDGPEGRALLRRAALAVGSKAGDVTAVLNSMINADKAQKPDWTVSSDGSFRSNAEGVMQDFDPKTNSWKTRGMPEISANAAKLGITAAVDNKGNVGFKGKDGYYTSEQDAVRSYDTKDKTKTSDKPAETAIPYTPPAGSPAAIELEKRKAAADAKDQATKTLRDTATAAATAAISASSQVDARKVQQMEGFSLLPVAVQAQISKIVNKPVSAIPAAKSTAAAAPAAQAIPTAAAAPAALTGEDRSAELRRKREESAAVAVAAKDKRKREEDAAAVAAKDKAASAATGPTKIYDWAPKTPISTDAATVAFIENLGPLNRDEVARYKVPPGKMIKLKGNQLYITDMP